MTAVLWLAARLPQTTSAGPVPAATRRSWELVQTENARLVGGLEMECAGAISAQDASMQ